MTVCVSWLSPSVCPCSVTLGVFVVRKWLLADSEEILSSRLQKRCGIVVCQDLLPPASGECAVLPHKSKMITERLKQYDK